VSHEDLSIFLVGVVFIVKDLREWISEDGACLIETDFMLLEISLRFVVIPFKLDANLDSIVSCFSNPQGKPAGLQLISNVRDSADVALLTPGVQESFPSQSHGFRTKVRSISGQVF
jgi:hypothetical protein